MKKTLKLALVALLLACLVVPTHRSQAASNDTTITYTVNTPTQAGQTIVATFDGAANSISASLYVASADTTGVAANSPDTSNLSLSTHSYWFANAFKIGIREDGGADPLAVTVTVNGGTPFICQLGDDRTCRGSLN